MGIEALKKLLGRKGQQFLCVPAGYSNGKEAFVANIEHEVAPPLTSDQLKVIENQIGYHDQLFSFLSLYGSIRLYCDTLSNASAFYLAHPGEWGDLQDDFHIWLDTIDDNEKSSLFPCWLEDSIVVGEIPSSGNYFLFLFRGSEKGKVFEFEHDGFEFIERGRCLYEFLEKISTVTESLLIDIQSHTRYSDGLTHTQWLPQEYRFRL